MQMIITWQNGHSEFVDIAPAPVLMDVKYFDITLPPLQKAEGDKSDWYDLYSREEMFIVEGCSAMIPLNITTKLPAGCEAYTVPRSSTFKNKGLIQTNHHSVIDESYHGDDDEWRMPVYAVPGMTHDWAYIDNKGTLIMVDKREDIPKGFPSIRGSHVRKGERVCQFRIQTHMPDIIFHEVGYLEGSSRGGFGTTGR